MELYEYIHILRRRWWLPIVLAILVGIFSTLQLRPWQSAPVSYHSTIRMLVGVNPLGEANPADYDPRYFAWLISEYLVDDFTEVVRSGLFAQNVSERLAEQDIQVPAGIIQGSSNTGKQHRIITLTLSWPHREQLAQMAEAVAAELSENADYYFQQLGTDDATITLLDAPVIHENRPIIRNRIELPLRIFLGFLVGIGLIFLFEYLNRSIRERSDLEQMGLTVLGEVPRGK